MQVFTFNVYLAENPPISRKLKLLGSHTLKDLHHTIIKAFHMVKVSKVSLYSATEKWRRKDRFALAKMPNDEVSALMEDVTIAGHFKNYRGKMVYDCSTHRGWTFNVELEKVKKKKDGKESKYPDWDNPLGHTLNDFKRDIALEEDEMDMEEGFMDETDLGEALKDFDNMNDEDE